MEAWTEKWIAGHQVDLPEMLAGREARARRQQKLLEKYGATLICFTLNIAGPVKVFPLSVRAFYEGVLAIGIKLARSVGEESCAWMQVLDNPWGYEAYYVVREDTLTVKRLMTEIEETHPFGRLFDIDVLWPDGSKACLPAHASANGAAANEAASPASLRPAPCQRQATEGRERMRRRKIIAGSLSGWNR